MTQLVPMMMTVRTKIMTSMSMNTAMIMMAMIRIKIQTMMIKYLLAIMIFKLGTNGYDNNDGYDSYLYTIQCHNYYD